jgi:hypothetical protein
LIGKKHVSILDSPESDLPVAGTQEDVSAPNGPKCGISVAVVQKHISVVDRCGRLIAVGVKDTNGRALSEGRAYEDKEE